ncbi:MAG TPA: hypothetical protein VI072_23220 [Polyangiaceae bacterium]
MASRLILGLSASFAALSLLAHCGSNSTSNDDGACKAPSCLPFDGSPPDEYVHDTSAPDANGNEDASGRHPLCGVSPSCDPDDEEACAGAGAPGEDASASDAGADATTSEPEAGGLDASADAAPRRYACTLPANGEQPRPECRLAGKDPADAPCNTSADCAPGLACVGTEHGQCRPYCCDGSDVCAERSYCAERSLRESVALGKDVRVPVCVTADRCDLGQPYPCQADAQSQDDCTCKDPQTACGVVRADGTTSCIEPGAGKAGEDCPCAWDHICSQATRTCLKLCSTSAEDDSTCGSGKCQASANLPRNYGVCVGS